MGPYLELVGRALFVSRWQKSVECVAFTFPLDILTRLSMAAHSTKDFISNLIYSLSAHFGISITFIAYIYWYCRGRGLASVFSCHSLEVQLEAGTHLIIVGFSTV